MKTLIYGIGNYGSNIYLSIYSMHRSQEIMGFVVSDNKPASTFMGKPLWNYDEIKEDLKKYKVIVAISEKKSYAVHEMLLHAGTSEIVQITMEEYKEAYAKAIQSFMEWPISRTNIFVDCFQGLGYKDNPKYLVEYLLDRRPNYKIFWNVESEFEEQFPEQIKIVKRYTPEYYEAFYTSAIIISNDGTEDHLPKRKEQYIINTWHGSGPFKKVGGDMPGVTQEIIDIFARRFQRADLLVSNSQDNTEMFRHSFFYCGEVQEWGSPRVDALFKGNDVRRRSAIKKRLGIRSDVSVVLYAPTFRDNLDEAVLCYDIPADFLKESLGKKIDNDYVFLFRTHLQFKRNQHKCDILNGWIDVSDYSDVMELLLISDVLITDYSSIMWDFSLLRKPVFLYQKDLQKYVDHERDFYWPVEQWPYPRAESLNELDKIIRDFDDEFYNRELTRFFKNDPSFDDGHACERITERIDDVIEFPQRYGKL